MNDTPGSAVLPEPWSRTLLDPWLGPGTKGYPADAPPRRASTIAAAGWSVARGDLPFPLAVIRRDALAHNLAWMQRFASGRGLQLAPHGKTTMSPQLFAQQLRAGAWGLTVANASQAQVAVAAGATRLIVANQVLAAADLRALDALRRRGVRVVFLLDSQAQLQALAGLGAGTAWEVLIELGVAGGRSGCRGLDEALALARSAAAGPAVRVVGLECYEGLAASGDDAADRARVAAFTEPLVQAAQAMAAQGLFASDEVLLSAGGSGVFDLVVPALQTALPGHRVTGVLRSGCYLTHDHGHYQRLVARAEARLGCPDGLQGALAVWALVLSCPEPGLAIVGAGKRDLSHDLGLPRPIGWCPGPQAAPQAAPEGWSVTGLNDQHAYLRWDDASPGPAVGDRVLLGISHPCTTFDKWRWMPVVDEGWSVVDAVVTCF